MLSYPFSVCLFVILALTACIPSTPSAPASHHDSQGLCLAQVGELGPDPGLSTMSPPMLGVPHSGYQAPALGLCLPSPTPNSPHPGLPRTADTLCLPDPAESIPTILDGFHSQEVWAGHTVELPCAASGYPIPAIRWLKDGRPLPADSRWTKRITGLTISDLRTEDSGTYICEVTNTFGSAEATGTLTVIGEQEKPLFQPHP